MSFSLPNPTVPTNGQPLNASPVLANIVALAQAIQSFDGSQITSGSIIEAALADAINPRLRDSSFVFDHVASGCVWTADTAGSSLNASMTSGIIFINGYRVVVPSITAQAFTASKDTYVDIDNLGNVTYSAQTNNAASPALAANSIRLAVIVAGSTSIAAAASINQGQESSLLPIASSIPYAVTDSIGNLICPHDPARRLLGYRQLNTGSFSTTGTSDITGLALNCIIPANRKVKVSGIIPNASASVANNGATMSVTDVTASAIVANGRGVGNSSGDDFTCSPVALYTPAAAGVRAYKASITRGTNAATVNINPSAGNVCYIMVELR